MGKQQDPADDVHDALTGYLADAYPAVTATLDLNAETPVPYVLIADDGGPNLRFRVFAEPTIRITAGAPSRTLARAIIADCVDWLTTPANRPASIARIKNVSAILMARDDDTGAALASITMPCIVRPA